MIPSPYRSAANLLSNGDLDWIADTVQAALLYDTYTPNFDSHEDMADINSHEVTGGSYVRVTLAGKALVPIPGNINWTSNDISFAAMTASDVRYLVLFKGGASDADRVLICLIEMDTNLDPSTEIVTFYVNTQGILNLGVSLGG
jgi:hypothetical protein